MSLSIRGEIMNTVQPLYFGESIKKKYRNRIQKQLLAGSQKLKRKILPIIIKIEGKNLFECHSTRDYIRLYNGDEAFILVGIVGERQEFNQYVEQFIQKHISNGNEISKETILAYLGGQVVESS